MPERLDGAVALVTGASSGIGRATALRLAAEGASVAVVARRRERLEEVAAAIEEAGGRALGLDADLSSADAAGAVVDRTVAVLGRLDILVNAAGVMFIGDSIEAPLEDWERMVDVNLEALLYVTKAALPHLRDGVGTSPRRVADVVNISSVAGRLAMAQVAIYNATKFAVTGATEAWRQEYASQSIRFSVIEPGAVETGLWHEQDEAQARYDRFLADLEILHPEDVAEAVAFVVTGPRRVAVSEIVIRPTDQR